MSQPSPRGFAPQLHRPRACGRLRPRRRWGYSPVMKTSLIVLGVIVVIVVVGFASLFGVYNGFVVADQNVNEKWAQVQKVYQRRAALIPNLAGTPQGVAPRGERG